MQVIPVDIVDEMKSSYIDYAMSVIVGRAIPDVRDGLKPVQRRILYAMHEMGLLSNRPHRKSARVVGEVLGKYHPHGDTAVYDALVRMAQDFTLRYPLVDGQGNFGSIDGDSPAAMRYTEVRLSKIAEEMLADIEKETVDFAPNFDESLEEPTVLPARIPNLLINGSSGIAVGMATSIPPHNLGEVVDALIHLLKGGDTSVDALMRIIKGPDFPTAGIIVGKEGIRQAYTSGRGKVTIRGRVKVEDNRIVITEIPYQVNKAKLVEQIAGLVKEKKLEGIKAVRDESDRDGVRVVIELKDANPDVLIKRLYKFSSLETSFGIINLVLVDGKPRILTLEGLLRTFIDHRRDVVVRRTEYELKKAEERFHIVDGLKIALKNIDEVIRIIKGSENTDIARKSLMTRFDLSEEQANAILAMRLQRLTALETEKLEEEYRTLESKISYCRELLSDEKKIDGVIIQELEELKEKYADSRKTEIMERVEEITEEDYIPDDRVVVLFTSKGFVKRILVDEFRVQRKGGKGVIGVGEGDTAELSVYAKNRDILLMFSAKGRAYWIHAYQIERGDRYSRGSSVNSLISLGDEDRIVAVIPLRSFRGDAVIATRKGYIKRVSLKRFVNAKRGGITAVSLDSGDEVSSVCTAHGELMVVTKHGRALRFSQKDVRTMGRTARGVRGIRLRQGDEVVSILPLRYNDVLILSDRGYGKRVRKGEFTVHRRGGMGVICLPEVAGSVAGVFDVEGDEEVIAFTRSGMAIRFRVKEIPRKGRTARGVIVTRDGIRMASVLRSEKKFK